MKISCYFGVVESDLLGKFERRDHSEVIIYKLCMCLGEYELSKVHILFIQRFCGGNIFSFVKSGMVLILLKH